MNAASNAAVASLPARAARAFMALVLAIGTSVYLPSNASAVGEDAGSMSVIALSPDGAVGAATTLELFPFAARTDGEASLYAAARFDAPDIRRVTAGELDGLD